MVDVDKKETERNNNVVSRFIILVGETKIPESVEALYV